MNQAFSTNRSPMFHLSTLALCERRFSVIHRSMTRDNINSRWLIPRVYPTIKHTVTKSRYFLGLSLFTMGGGLLSFSGVETLTGTASSTSLSLGQEDSLLDILSHTCRGAVSLRSLLGTQAVSWDFFLFTTVH